MRATAVFILWSNTFDLLRPAGKIKDFIKFDLGNLAMVTGGHNNGRVGTIVHKERHR
jgi:small subunit ribosomal protein S4e